MPLTGQRRGKEPAIFGSPFRGNGPASRAIVAMAVGGAFASDTATGLIAVAHRVAGVRSFQ